jgi:uncharacterized protein (DUF1501 family)
MHRRDFFRHAGALGAAAAFGQLGWLTAQAQQATDYKALVCVFLYGGNDGNNTLVPIDTAYSAYATARGPIALAQSALLPLQEASGAARYGLHPQLGGLQALWNAGQLAVVHNVGTLTQPLSRAQYASAGASKPVSLFSHIDQQGQWQASLSGGPSNTGWGGRLCDELTALNASAQVPAMISTVGNNLFVTGKATQALTVPLSGTFGLRGFDTSAAAAARQSALQQLLSLDRSGDLVTATQDTMSGALRSAATLNPILTATTGTAASYFTGLTSNVSKQLLAIAKIVEARAMLGARRQVFLVSLGSFDTHTNELNTHDTLFAQLSAALKAFHDAMGAIGAGTGVTSFTLSDFSRTYKPNTNGGTDHGWGNVAFVMGGAVKGRQYYGTAPVLTNGGPDDEGNEGRWIPTTSVDQYAATLATWFGVDATALARVLPNLKSFPAAPPAFI